MDALAEHVMLVSGAAGGIGAAAARAAVDRGVAVALADRDHAAASRLAAELASGEVAAVAYEVDVSDPASSARMVGKVEADFGRIDVLVNAAGIIRSAELLAVDPADWDAEMGVNARGAFFLLQAVARGLIERGSGGAIVNLSSVAGRSGRPLNSVYAASKAAVISLTKSAALALAPHGVRVNAVAPGVVDTPMTTRLHESRSALTGRSVQSSLDEMAATIPLGHIASPEEIARVIMFLAFEESAYMTGQCLNACGGMEMD